jgi:2-polyprenyl-3-methyl-5-hydroxy-6-metoxy-1,4-benzoquinol methylase
MKDYTDEEVAAYYNSLADRLYKNRTEGDKLFNDYIEMPATLKLVGQIKKGQKILDIGCGIGKYSKLFATAGAAVTAIDVSEKMIELAKDNCKGLEITFIHASFDEANLGESFDVILGSFMIGYFSDLVRFFAKIHSLLNSSGRVIISMIHPIRLNSIKHDCRSYEMERYFNGGFYNAVIVQNEPTIPQRKRTISEVIEAAFEGGLVVERLLEPVPINPPVDDRTSFYFRCPSVLVTRLRKG